MKSKSNNFYVVADLKSLYSIFIGGGNRVFTFDPKWLQTYWWRDPINSFKVYQRYAFDIYF